MFKRYLNPLLLLIPPGDVGGDGGSTEKVAGSESSGSVTSGTASDAMIKAAMASESSTGDSTTESEAVAVANLPQTGGDGKPATNTDAKGPQGVVGQPKATGEAPEPRIVAAVKNAREAAIAETEQKYAWAKGVDKQAVDVAFGVAQEILSDAPAFAAKLAAELGMKLVPVGEAKDGSSVGVGKFTLPKAKLRSEDGLGAFAEDQMPEIIEGIRAEIRAEMEGQLKPLLDDKKAAAIAAEKAEATRYANHAAATVMADLRARPYFQMKDAAGNLVDNPKIMEYILAIPDAERRANPMLAFHRAYSTFIEKDVMPTLGQAQQQTIRNQNQRKAAGSEGAHPANAIGETKPREIRGVSDLAKRMEEMAAGSA